MPSASRDLHSAQHQSTSAIAYSPAEKRSGYSDNSTARTACWRAAKTTIGEPEGIAPLGPHSRPFTPCCAVLPPMAKRPQYHPEPNRCKPGASVYHPPATGP